MLLFTSEAAGGARSYGIVEIQTDDGRRGYGEPYAAVNMPSACHAAVAVLADEMVGRPADPATLARRLYALTEYFDHGGLVFCVVGAIEWALHDLAAQRAGQPLHRYLNAA
jgi:L-alanine-DL-glutamate epimerase-like enolase superfamily enzyme